MSDDGSPYLNRPRRSLGEVLRDRFVKGERVRHPSWGECEIADLVGAPQVSAKLRLADGSEVWAPVTVLDKLETRSTQEGQKP